MNKLIQLILIIILTQTSLIAQGLSFKNVEAFKNPKAIGAHLDSLVALKQFSGTAYVSKGEEVILQKAYGYANIKDEVPNLIDTKFNIGSINKIFTKVCVMQLVDKGKISLNDKIVKYIPELKMEMADEITIEHLYKMSSGFGDYLDSEKYQKTYRSFSNMEDYLSIISELKLGFKPGTSMQYSNAGYELLGIMIQRVSGQNYYDYVRKNIYDKANMKNSGSFKRDGTTENLAYAYSQFKPGETFGKPKESTKNIVFYNADDRLPLRGSAAGGGYSTAMDFLKFSKALNQNKFMSNKATELFHSLSRGFPGSKTLMGAGGSYGISAMMYFNYTKDFAVIVLSNLDPPAATNIGAKIIKSLEFGTF